MFGKNKIREIQVKNHIQLEQQLIFVLFSKYVLSLRGKEIVDREGVTEEYISKSVLVEAVCKMLNEYAGELEEYGG
jgi:hypothetical protein